MEQKKIFVDINNARGREDLTAKLQRSLDTEEDPFAPTNIQSFNRKPILKTKEYWFVTEAENKYPGAENHFLIISNEYWETVFDITPAASSELIEIMKELSREFKITGGGYFSRVGDTTITGATVKRMHVHFFKPKPGAGVITIPLGRKS